jgi:hypothetical protein
MSSCLRDTPTVRKNCRYVIHREDNVLQVDFSREPDPPAPRFPGANGLRELPEEDIEQEWSFGESSRALAGRKSSPTPCLATG